MGQIAGGAICGAHSCCGLALCNGYSTDTKSKYLPVSLFFSSLRQMMFTTLTHGSQLPPPHTRVSTGYPDQDMRVLYVRLITLHATISHPVGAVSLD